MRDGILRSSKISPPQTLFLMKKKKSYCMVEKQGRYHVNHVTKLNNTLG